MLMHALSEVTQSVLRTYITYHLAADRKLADWDIGKFNIFDNDAQLYRIRTTSTHIVQKIQQTDSVVDEPRDDS